MNAIFHRVSIRKYQDRPIEEEKIVKLLQAAMQAPSAANQQPWEYYVVTNQEKKEELSKVSPYAGFAKDAPVIFVPCYRTQGLLAPAYAHIDLSASVENLLLEADALGLGAVWMGIAPQEERMEAVRKVTDLSEELHAFALISCGYPAEERPQQPRYDESRVHYIK